MSTPHHIQIIRNNNETFVNISTMPLPDVFAMFYAGLSLVSKNANMSFDDVLSTLGELHQYANKTNQA